MTYTDVNIVQQLTERQHGETGVNPLLGIELPVARHNSKPDLTMRNALTFRYGPILGNLFWRDYMEAKYGS